MHLNQQWPYYEAFNLSLQCFAVFFPNKNKVYSSRSLPEPAHSTSFLKMAIICRSGRGCKVLYCVCTGAIALFHVPLFFGNQCTSIQLSQPLIGFILPFAIWCSSSSFFVVFAFSTIMKVCCQFHHETLFITTLHFVKAKIAVDLKRFLYFKLIFWVLQYSYSFWILCEWNITLCCSCS